MSDMVKAETQGSGMMWFDDREQVELFKTTILGKDFTDGEMKLALAICKQTGMNPLTRQIYFVKRKGKMTPQTGIDGFRSKAEESGNYAGNDEPLYDEGLTEFAMRKAGRKQPSTATVTVWKVVEGVKCAFTATAEWGAYSVSGDQGFMWSKMPFLMLAKCAEALALRKAFPSKLGGLYTSDEMQQADREKPPMQEPQRKAQPQKPPAGQAPPKEEKKESPEAAPQGNTAPSTPAAGGPEPKDNYPDDRKANDAQRKRFYAIYKTAGWTDDQAKTMLLDFSVTSSKLIPLSMYEQFCTIVEKPYADYVPPSEPD